jgi:TRAP-type C4-dicarboxylate transport system permease small subunit
MGRWSLRRALLLSASLLGLSFFATWMVFATSYVAETLHYLASNPSPTRFLELLWALFQMAASAMGFVLDLILILMQLGDVDA